MGGVALGDETAGLAARYKAQILEAVDRQMSEGVVDHQRTVFFQGEVPTLSAFVTTSFLGRTDPPPSARCPLRFRVRQFFLLQSRPPSELRRATTGDQTTGGTSYSPSL